MRKLFVDTNIFLRYLTGDDKVKFENCQMMLKKTHEGKIIIATSNMVIAELIWTLQSYYKVPKADIMEKISLIVGEKHLFIPDKDIIAEALVLFGRKNVDYIDAYNAVFMRHHGMDAIYSYDKDFDLLEGVRRTEP